MFRYLSVRYATAYRQNALLRRPLQAAYSTRQPDEPLTASEARQPPKEHNRRAGETNRRVEAPSKPKSAAPSDNSPTAQQTLQQLLRLHEAYHRQQMEVMHKMMEAQRQHQEALGKLKRSWLQVF
ncbi:hypothetical protein ACHAPT_001064 [Fusarium lateritium]